MPETALEAALQHFMGQMPQAFACECAICPLLARRVPLFIRFQQHTKTQRKEREML
jgi:hypothetical protein